MAIMVFAGPTISGMEPPRKPVSNKLETLDSHPTQRKNIVWLLAMLRQFDNF